MNVCVDFYMSDRHRIEECDECKRLNPVTKDDFIHYILVRRDLPFGTTLAMVAHAAAESNYGNHYTVAVLGVRNLSRLKKYETKLKQAEVGFVSVCEPDMPWDGQLMSIGLHPGPRERLAPLFTNLQTYKEWEGPKEVKDDGSKGC